MTTVTRNYIHIEKTLANRHQYLDAYNRITPPCEIEFGRKSTLVDKTYMYMFLV